MRLEEPEIRETCAGEDGEECFLPRSTSVSGFQEHIDLIREIHGKTKNAIRTREKLLEEHSIGISYSTLTRLLRDNGIGGRTPVRAGRYEFQAGEEMQMDTSPYRIQIGERTTRVQCAAIVLAWSRMAYIEFFPRFTRFENKVFLLHSLSFFGGSCSRCVIDNTSVIVSSGAGPDAIMAPEMEAFSALFDFHFMAHPVGKPDRKGRVERFFRYVEGNFLSGRTFEDWDDLNRQAVQWCQTTANTRIIREISRSPQEGFHLEKPALNPLPVHLPPVYKSIQRNVNPEGLVCIDTNRYSVPDRFLGKTVEVNVHWDKIMVYHRGNFVAEHQRIRENIGARVTEKGHHRKLHGLKKARAREEEELLGKHEVLDEYVKFLKERKGFRKSQLKSLLGLFRTYPEGPFLEAVGDALQYGLCDMSRLENMILRNVDKTFFNLGDDGDENQGL